MCSSTWNKKTSVEEDLVADNPKKTKGKHNRWTVMVEGLSLDSIVGKWKGGNRRSEDDGTHHYDQRQ